MSKAKVEIRICKHTKKPVLMQQISDGWICLHNENPEDDKKDVEQFKKQMA